MRCTHKSQTVNPEIKPTQPRTEATSKPMGSVLCLLLELLATNSRRKVGF